VSSMDSPKEDAMEDYRLPTNEMVRRLIPQP
jgi:hypothetical protein